MGFGVRATPLSNPRCCVQTKSRIMRRQSSAYIESNSDNVRTPVSLLSERHLRVTVRRRMMWLAAFADSPSRRATNTSRTVASGPNDWDLSVRRRLQTFRPRQVDKLGGPLGMLLSVSHARTPPSMTGISVSVVAFRPSAPGSLASSAARSACSCRSPSGFGSASHQPVQGRAAKSTLGEVSREDKVWPPNKTYIIDNDAALPQWPPPAAKIRKVP
jgi:hypothetical protein